MRKKRIGLVIFDCDGVMFDSCQANMNFYNHILLHFGRPPIAEDVQAFAHMQTADATIGRLFDGTPHAEDAKKYRLQMDYTPFIEDMIIEPGLKDLLRRLKPDFGLAVATNRSTTIDAVLEANGLEEFFDIVVGSLDVENPKPDPESVYKILDFFRRGPDQAAYIGDSMVDYETAKAAGVHFIAYRNDNLDTPFMAESMHEVEGILRDIEARGRGDTDLGSAASARRGA